MGNLAHSEPGPVVPVSPSLWSSWTATIYENPDEFVFIKENSLGQMSETLIRLGVPTSVEAEHIQTGFQIDTFD